MKAFEKLMYPLLVIILCWVVYVSRTHGPYFESQVVGQDGLISWASFWTLLFAAVMCFFRASILRPFHRGKFFTTGLVVQGFLFLFFAMDEMSWLQRVIGFESPDFFKLRNVLGQTNFYNLVIMGVRLNSIIFTLAVKIAATLYFFVLPFLYNRWPIVKESFNNYGIPMPRYTQVGAYAVLAAFMLIIPSENRHTVFEFCFYWILVLMMYHPLNDDIFSRKSLVR